MKALSLPGNEEIIGIGERRRTFWPGPRSRGPLRRPCLKVRWGYTILRVAQGCYENDDCQRNGGSLQQCGSLSCVWASLKELLIQPIFSTQETAWVPLPDPPLLPPLGFFSMSVNKP